MSFRVEEGIAWRRQVASAARPRTIRDAMPRAIRQSPVPAPFVSDMVVQVGGDLVDPALGDRAREVARVEPHPPRHELGHASSVMRAPCREGAVACWLVASACSATRAPWPVSS